MLDTAAAVPMRNDDLRVNERRWRRKKLFGNRRRSLIARLSPILVLLTVLVLLVLWFEVPPFDIDTSLEFIKVSQ